LISRDENGKELKKNVIQIAVSITIILVLLKKKYLEIKNSSYYIYSPQESDDT